MMSTEDKPITNTEDVIDSRDILARIQYLKDAWAHAAEANPDDFALSGDDWRVHLAEDEAEELEALMELVEEAGDYSEDWEYGATLIRGTYFTEYAQELAEDIGAVGSDAQWPLYCIDWERAARDLRMDYTAVEFDGVTYWYR